LGYNEEIKFHPLLASNEFGVEEFVPLDENDVTSSIIDFYETFGQKFFCRYFCLFLFYRAGDEKTLGFKMSTNLMTNTFHKLIPDGALEVEAVGCKSGSLDVVVDNGSVGVVVRAFDGALEVEAVCFKSGSSDVVVGNGSVGASRSSDVVVGNGSVGADGADGSTVFFMKRLPKFFW
jgi:hypothetical protein